MTPAEVAALIGKPSDVKGQSVWFLDGNRRLSIEFDESGRAIEIDVAEYHANTSFLAKLRGWLGF